MKLTDYLVAIPDSVGEEIVLVDTNHKIVFLNKTAKENYKERFGENLEGKSVFDCHNENSKKIILEVFKRLKQGENKIEIEGTPSKKSFIVAVRDKNGNLIGYFEKFEKR